MNFDWILNPLTQYAALAVGLVCCLVLFISSKVELQAVRRMAQEAGESAASSVNGLTTEIEGIRKGVRELEAAPPVAAAPGEGLNLTKRAQALRMYRRGEPVSCIAASLKAPSNEIELLLKIQKLVNPQQS